MPHKRREDYNAYMSEYCKKRYHTRRQEALEHLGGVYVSCGSTENLEFDHTNPENKEYAIGKIITGCNLKKVYKELEKCQLLCKKCHLKKSKEELSAQQFGENNSYAKLDNEQVKEIRELYSTKKYTHRELGKLFGVSRSTISYLLSNKTYNHV